eukprot:CAMPEP_0178421208 /NCGR_PEP_ID=MMETSP0689_2-20121128/26530_1 /TAXON_ID=160604 /ORGANISM="Amphidinium massartii, Strain CS-259" /LENGTH=138 /DNA_ID=CAMNT_0020042715 /DNA_START=52 /DNA_END=468 /DNA_ORIENTATION=+
MAAMKSEFPPRSLVNEVMDADLKLEEKAGRRRRRKTKVSGKKSRKQQSPSSLVSLAEENLNPADVSPVQHKESPCWISLSLARPVEDGSWLFDEGAEPPKPLVFYLPPLDEIPGADIKDVIMDDDWEAFERAVWGQIL